MTADVHDTTSGSPEGLSPEELDGIPPDIARRLLRAFNRSPSSWISLIDKNLTTRYIGLSASWIQGTDTSRRHGKSSLERLHPDDVEPLLHALDQLRAATPETTPTVPVVEPLRYRIRRLDRPGYLTVEAQVLNLLDDPVTQGLVLISRPAGGGLDDVGHVLDLLVDDAPLCDVLAGCAGVVPHYLGSAAVVAFVDDETVIGVPDGSPVRAFCDDPRWWREAADTGAHHAPLDFAGFPADLAEQARGLGFKSAWAIPLPESSSGDIMGCVMVWVRIAVESNIATDEGLHKTARLARLVIGEQRTHHALRREALTDPLTGAGNRSALRRRLDESKDEVTVAVIDLDDFKPINDTYGHDTGDIVLQIVAERLLSAVRDDDLVVRLGGDEFAIVFAEGSSPAGVTRSTSRITASIREPMRVADLDLAVGASVGLATGHPPDVLQDADAALYDAKRHNKGIADR